MRTPPRPGPPDEFEIARQSAARDRYVRSINLALTPKERMAKFHALQKVCFDRLQRNPEALARFWRRNFRERSIPHGPDAFR